MMEMMSAVGYRRALSTQERQPGFLRCMIVVFGVGMACSAAGQSFTSLAGGQFDLAPALGLRDSCNVRVNSFEIGRPITAWEFSAFQDEMHSLSVNGLDPAGRVDPTATCGGSAHCMSWVEATAYCQWLTQKDTSAQWTYRLPHLLEWLYTMEAGLFDKEERGCWLLNAKDETGSSCQMPFYLYDCKDEDRLALRRKMVAFANTIAHPKFGLDGNYWDFMHYPDVGFRVVRVQTSVGGR